jgi:biopolymer transport protein ExbD
MKTTRLASSTRTEGAAIVLSSYGLAASVVFLVPVIAVAVFVCLYCHGIPVDLPDAGGTTVIHASSDDVLVTIRSSKTVFVQSTVYRPENAGRGLAEARRGRSPGCRLILKCDRNVTLSTMNTVIRSARDSGWSSLCLVTYEGNMVRAYALAGAA